MEINSKPIYYMVCTYDEIYNDPFKNMLTSYGWCSEMDEYPEDCHYLLGVF